MSGRVSVMSAILAIALVLAATTAAHADPADDLLGPNAAAVVSGNNQFAFDLYGRLAGEEDSNLFFSPYSISTALAMTYAGARGNTATEMAEVLHFSLPPADLHAAFGDVIADLNGEWRDGYQLSTANRLWGQQGYSFLPEFLDVTRECYGAELAEVDFMGETEAARQAINQWVADRTQQKIRDLIALGQLPPPTRLALTNAIYFQSNWKHQFDPERTTDAPFWTAPDEQITVSMMRQTNDFNYAALPALQILELPYINEDLSIWLLLPNERDGLADLESWLTAETLSQSIDQTELQEVRVSMPKFGMTQSFELSDVLKSLGMPDAFDGSAADFSGMNGKRDLSISKVIHKAFLNWDETGTEAAAATVVVGPGSAPMPEFSADHPFVFLIRDSRTESILFMGRAADPQIGAPGIIPEPAALALLALGGMTVRRRRT